MPGRPDLMYRIAIAWLLLLIVLAAGASWLPLPDPLALDLSGSLAAPSARHLAGTDELGRDVLSRLLHAARSTLLIVVGASALALAIATTLGGLAGYLGGWLDRAIRLGVDLFWSVPFVIFVVLIISVVGVSITSLIVTIGVVNWVGPARVIRAEAARLRDADFVVAARAHGYSRPFILAREVVPNLHRTLLTLAAYGAIEVLTLETGLAFLGLSLPAPRPTWGGMLADGLGYFSSAWWVVIGTSAFVTITLSSLQVIARREETARSG
jgi:peptide/nickel transport system permease protein